jgi:large subunit ribosomal protein L31e
MIERTYNVPLRKGFHETAKHKKTKKAVAVLKEFLSRHMHSDKILIGKNLNQELWKHGIKNPPHHVKIHVIKEDDGTVKAELHGFKYDHKKKEEKDKKETPEKKKDTKKEDTKATPKTSVKTKVVKDADVSEKLDDTVVDEAAAEESAVEKKEVKPKKTVPKKKSEK